MLEEFRQLLSEKQSKKVPNDLPNMCYRTKVDLTKYIEEHAFNFDRAFDETSTNQQVL